MLYIQYIWNCELYGIDLRMANFSRNMWSYFMSVNKDKRMLHLLAVQTEF
jgi:hypothetical protein